MFLRCFNGSEKDKVAKRDFCYFPFFDVNINILKNDFNTERNDNPIDLKFDAKDLNNVLVRL